LIYKIEEGKVTPYNNKKENEETDVIVPISNQTLIQLADEAERRIDAINKIKRVAIKLTNPHDWTDQGGRHI